MESLRLSPPSPEDRGSAPESARGDALAALRVRFWGYGGEQGKLRDLLWSGDQQVAELVQNLIGNGQGRLVEEYPSIAVAHFRDPLQALAAAKSLQQRLLSFHREPPESQVVAAIVVDHQCKPVGAGSATAKAMAEARPATESLLIEANSAQILVSEKIYDLARTVPGFDFAAKPVREPAEGGTSETLYELRWTDESTYGHLRQTSRGTGFNFPRERRYSIQSELGRGCMGVVYKAYDEVIGRSVALKTIAVNRSFPNRDELIERLKQEAKAAGSLDHPNIITIFDVGQEEDLLYLSMQLVEGETLSAMLATGNLPPLMDLLSYAEQICNAVGFAHQRGVIHRDLKPANFMATNQGAIKVLDFGIAKLEDATLTQTGMIVGTPTYMAPEQAKARKVDQRSDIFSLGSVFYEMFTREKPFKGDITTVLYKLIHEDPPPPSVINPALPIGIDAIIRKALAKDPAERFQSCEEMRDAFRQQAVLLQQTALSKPATAVQAQPTVTVEDLLAEVRPQRSHRRGRIWIAVASCFFLASAGGGAWVFHIKVKTGSYPPALVKVFRALKPGKARPAADSSPGAGTQDAPGSDATTTNSGQPPTSNSSTAQTADQGNVSANSSSVPPAGSQPLQARTNAGDTSSQSGSESSATPAPVPTQTTLAAASEPSESTDVNPFEPRKRAQKPVAADAGDATVKVEGFTRRDVPDLLSRAEDAAGRGDYRQARYEYNIILRLDSRNAAARAGLRRVQEAEEER